VAVCGELECGYSEGVVVRFRQSGGEMAQVGSFAQEERVSCGGFREKLYRAGWAIVRRGR